MQAFFKAALILMGSTLMTAQALSAGFECKIEVFEGVITSYSQKLYMGQTSYENCEQICRKEAVEYNYQANSMDRLECSMKLAKTGAWIVFYQRGKWNQSNIKMIQMHNK